MYNFKKSDISRMNPSKYPIAISLAVLAFTSAAAIQAQEVSSLAAPEQPEIAANVAAEAKPGTTDAGSAGLPETKPHEKGTKVKSEATPSLTAGITKSCKEREKRMTAMNDAMLKLREAGDEEAAGRLEARLEAMIETKDPREDDALLANKAELLLMKRSVLELSAEVANLRAVLEQNNRIIDEILKKAVPDISASVIEEMKNQAKKQEVRKVP
jgi:hypothetical protein